MAISVNFTIESVDYYVVSITKGYDGINQFLDFDITLNNSSAGDVSDSITACLLPPTMAQPKTSFGWVWFTQKADRIVSADTGLKAFTAGIEIPKADKNYASLNLDAEKNDVTLHVKKDDKSPVSLTLNSAEMTLVLEAKAGDHKSDFTLDAGKGTGKWHAKNGTKGFDFSYAAGKSAKLTVKEAKTLTIDIASATIALKTDTKLMRRR